MCAGWKESGVLGIDESANGIGRQPSLARAVRPVDELGFHAPGIGIYRSVLLDSGVLLAVEILL